MQSQLSSKNQDLDIANGSITDLKGRIDTLESTIESSEARQQQLSKDLDTSRCLRKDAKDKMANHSE